MNIRLARARSESLIRMGRYQPGPQVRSGASLLVSPIEKLRDSSSPSPFDFSAHGRVKIRPSPQFNPAAAGIYESDARPLASLVTPAGAALKFIEPSPLDSRPAVDCFRFHVKFP